MIENIIQYFGIGFVGLGIEIILYSTASIITKKKSLRWIITFLLNVIGVGLYYLIEIK